METAWKKGLASLCLLLLGALTLSAEPAQVVLPGTIQGALGGANWNTNTDTTRMEEVAPGLWEFVAAFPKGSFEYKVAVNGTWDENYGKDGALGGGNISLVVKAKDSIVKFVFDYNNKTIYDSVNNPDKVSAPATVPPRKAVAPAKPSLGKAFLDGNDRIRLWLDTPADPSPWLAAAVLTIGGKPEKLRAVKAGSLSTKAGQDVLDPSKIVLPGTIQSALGGAEWNPNGDITRMWEVSPGVYEFIAAFPKGSYVYKVAKGGGWEENWGKGGAAGADNVSLAVPRDGTIVRFVFDLKAKKLADSINDPAVVKAPAAVPPTPAYALATSSVASNAVDVFLARPLAAADLNQAIKLVLGGKEYQVFAREALSDPAYAYQGDDLGSRWGKSATAFKVWSPVAQAVSLELFDQAVGGNPRVVPMKPGAQGVWSATVEGDLHGVFYQYRLNSYGSEHVAPDIYCYSASLDGKRSQVVDLGRTDPLDWAKDRSPVLAKTTDAVIYEMHTRDFSIDASSGVKPEWRGGYLGVSQRGTTLPGTSLPTGLDHLVRLGITDIHLLPVQKFNPANMASYNWGYETTLFNVPDARYGTVPADGLRNINEFKQMVQGVHAAGIRIIMDVVYNHTVPVKGDASAFDATVPFYYFRTDDAGHFLNESGVGNAMHDERPMVRKYIKESLVYWLKEYKVDGFRFDLVGMFTRDTVKELTQAVRALRPDAVLYGEPWTGGGPTRFGKGEQKGLDFAVFNDNFRNVLRGDLDGTRKGYVMGGPGMPIEIQRGLAGSFDFGGNIKDFAAAPGESINYVSAHDNSALWDKVEKSMSGADAAAKAKAVKMAGAMVLVAQGIPFLEGGVEMGRTKGGNANSYNAPDAVNRFDWSRLPEFKAVSDYYAGLIALRRAHPAFRMADPAQVRKALSFLPGRSAASPVVSLKLDGAVAGDSWKTILVVANGKPSRENYTLPQGEWNLVVDADRAGNQSLATLSGVQALEASTVYVFYQD